MSNEKEKSLNGTSSKLDRNRTVKMRYKDFSRHVKAVIAATAVATTAVIGAGHVAIDKMNQNAVVSRMSHEFQVNCIFPETHRTQDNEHFYYDYEDIAEYIEGMDDFETGVYLSTQTIGEYQTDKVMRYTTYDSYDAFLESHSYKDTKDFEKEMKDRLVNEDSIHQMMQEVETSKQDHTPKLEGGTK